MTADFYSLTPDRVLDAVERSGHYTTGLCYALNSLENRVYEVELDDRRRVVAKFYRPLRWSEQTILDEHRLLASLQQAEIPVCAVEAFADGKTLHQTPEGIYYALFPRTGGRCPDELLAGEFEQLGRLLGRIHNVAAALNLTARPILSPQTYGRDCLALILQRTQMPPGLHQRYVDAVNQLANLGDELMQDTETFVVHADCHRANLLRGRDNFFFLDFDDCARAPAVQDFWLLLPARPTDCPRELEELLKGYEQFREFDRRTLRLVEVLRGLRYVRYAAWIAQRWDDPSFPRAFPAWGGDNYWEAQLADVYDQIRCLLEQQQR
jgi:Ser/Thr protein kinase RdoA (MazF antagonist)